MSAPAEPQADRPARVLIVDDEPAHVEAIRRALEASEAPFTVREAASLAGCRAAVAVEAPDIALLDLNLPDGRAIELLTSPPEQARFPILIMTSFGNERTAVEAMKAGALDYVVKSPEAFGLMPRTLQRAGREWRLLREHARSEEEVRRLNAELERRVGERTSQLEAANRELEAFTYSVSHDLRAPLRAIDGFTGILAQEYGPGLDDEGRRLLEIVRRNVGKMDVLIADLLALSRVARGEIHGSRIDMAALAGEVWREVAGAASCEEISFSVGDLPPACGDRNLIRQVFANLLANAVKYSRPKAVRRVEVVGRAEDGRGRYIVRDTGVGFDPEYAHKLFGAFQRLHRPEEFEGTGVGLAIVQRIVHRHGGRVSAEGRPGDGAAFSFTLPLADR